MVLYSSRKLALCFDFLLIWYEDFGDARSEEISQHPESKPKACSPYIVTFHHVLSLRRGFSYFDNRLQVPSNSQSRTYLSGHS